MGKVTMGAMFIAHIVGIILGLCFSAGGVAMLVIGALSVSNYWVEVLGHLPIDFGGSIAMIVFGALICSGLLGRWCNHNCE